MPRVRFDTAQPDDDAQLRRLLAETPMPGRFQISLRREPDYFQAAAVEGPFHQTVVARDVEQQRIVGLGCRSVRQRYVNGIPQPIGYLSGLRLLPKYRRFGLVGRGYRYLRSLHADGRAALYLTTVAQGNDVALATLTSGRAGLPRYHGAGMYYTLAIPLRPPRVTAPLGIQVRPAAADDVPQLLDFLSAAGPGRQFFPCYDSADFFAQATFRNLRPQDLLLAFQHGKLVGTLALWDQRAFRQTVVEGYDRSVTRIRPMYNLWAKLRGLPTLPPPGTPLNFWMAALPVVQSDDGAVFRVLLGRLLQHAVKTASADAGYVLLGLHERDPLLQIAMPYCSHKYLTHLYYVCWEDGEALRQQLDDRPPYLELGCL